MKNEIKELTPKQENFINAYIETGNMTNASKKAKISRNTAYTYLKNNKVKEVISQMNKNFVRITIYNGKRELQKQMQILKEDFK